MPQTSNVNYPGAPTPPKKRHPFRIGCLSVIGLFILIIIIVAVANSGGSKTPSPVGSNAPAAVAATPNTPSIPVAGSTVRDGKFQFKITSVTHAKSTGDTADGLGETAQGEFTILHVTATNIGTEAQTLDDSNQYVYDASGRKYDADSDADIDLGGDNGANSVWIESINPGNTVQGQIAFDLPAGTKAVKAELHDSVFSGGVTVALP